MSKILPQPLPPALTMSKPFSAAATPPTATPPPRPVDRRQQHQGVLSSIASWIIFRLLIAFRTLWLLVHQAAITSACLAEWWLFHVAVSTAPESEPGPSTPTSSFSSSSSSSSSASSSSTLSGCKSTTTQRKQPVSACHPRTLAARAVRWAIDPARSLPASTELRVPKHVGIVAPTLSKAAWGPYARFLPIWQRVVPKSWIPRPEAQVVAAICQLVALLPDTEFVSVTVLLTPGMDSDALLLALHTTSHSLRRPIEVVTPLAATVLPASPSSLANAASTANTKPRLSRRLSCLNRPGAHGTRPGVPLTVYLADPAIHGKSLIARYASPALSPDQSDPAHISRNVLPDPDLLILGVPSCVLMGYPPWGLRLTELHHERAAWMVTPARVVRAVRRYQGVEQRYGK
ncbi:hypothetical protein BCR44DRAFT_25782 [Catenaria anguillulae PL171]|uniref:ditrans,polycis-polyprenyl diphosphate synthase [(2E,6E)-farnesyldiphosphate specific] n=1 Tax=Catenaria anguillulae PL171 TaxID=765915 RepID=A0A1Y2HK49_9FUNG|nr:hypothetical protein BCR44DRAFT_25782 [Catenaria anguillulae PL171]